MGILIAGKEVTAGAPIFFCVCKILAVFTLFFWISLLLSMQLI